MVNKIAVNLNPTKGKKLIMEDEDAWLYGDEPSAEVSEEAVDKPIDTETEENVSNVHTNLKLLL